MNTKEAIQKIQKSNTPQLSISSMYHDSNFFEHSQRLAKILAASDFVPDTFKGNVPNCWLAVWKGLQYEIDPLAVMGSMYVIHGRPAMDAKFVISMLHRSGRIRGQLKWHFKGTGDNLTCTCVAISSDDGSEQTLSMSIADAKAHGWYAKKGSKWPLMPEQMLRYRTGSWLINAYYPEVLLGMMTAEEVRDEMAVDVTPTPEPEEDKSVEALLASGKKKKAAKKKQEPTPEPDIIVEEHINEETGEITEQKVESSTEPDPSYIDSLFERIEELSINAKLSKVNPATRTSPFTDVTRDFEQKFNKDIGEMNGDELQEFIEELESNL